MKFIKKYEKFTISYKEIENIGNVVFSITSDGEIWHEIANEMMKKYKTNELTKEIKVKPLFIVVKNNYVMSITNDATALCPYENDTIYHYELIKKDEPYNLKNSDFVKFNKNTYLLEKVNIPDNILIPSLDKDGNVTDSATQLDIVQSQYAEYEGMDTPSTLEEMKQQDPALATEYLNMMIELRGLIYTLSAGVQPQAAEDKAVGFAALPIPQPSKALKDFKNRFKLTK